MSVETIHVVRDTELLLILPPLLPPLLHHVDGVELELDDELLAATDWVTIVLTRDVKRVRWFVFARSVTCSRTLMESEFPRSVPPEL